MEIVDQLGEGSHLGLQRRNRLGGKAPDPVLNRLQLAAQHRQRGTQLMEISAIRSRRICWLRSRVLASWLKSCARRPSSSPPVTVTRVEKSPAASLWVPSTSRFTGASRPRANGKVASAASRVARATISQLVRFCCRSKLMSVLRVSRSTGEAITLPTSAPLTTMLRWVPSSGTRSRGPTSTRPD